MKISIGKKTILFTHPVLIIGSYDMDFNPDIAAVAWGGICCSEPPSVAISLRKSRLTYENIMLNKAFTVNIPSREQVGSADYSGVYSGRDEDKFAATGLTPVNSGIVSAPYIKEYPLSMLCKLSHTIEIGIHTQFIGEILDVLVNDDILNEEGLPDISKARPIIYDSVSRSYFGIDEMISKAYIRVKK
ncbi:MAG: flavin reductase domain protein, FMN-binding protein [Ignavibacteria bacterium]|nr:flavin reductase domain protein, FMN-binding protein [Ignavibacteria bacterium]